MWFHFLESLVHSGHCYTVNTVLFQYHKISMVIPWYFLFHFHETAMVFISNNVGTFVSLSDSKHKLFYTSTQYVGKII